MKNCAYYQQLISMLADRELTAEEGEELAEHARSCEECRALYAAFASLSEALKNDLEDPPEELSELVMASVRRDGIKKKNSTQKRTFRMIAAAACALIVIGAGATAAFGNRGKNTMMSAAPAAYDAVYEEAALMDDAGTYGTDTEADNAPMMSLYGAAAGAEEPTEPIPVSNDFAAPAAETTKSEDEMIAEALRRAEEPETVAEIVDVTGQGRGNRIRSLLTGTSGNLPATSTPDRRFMLRFDADGISTQVLISVYGDKVFYISLSGEQTDMYLADCTWAKLRSAIYD